MLTLCEVTLLGESIYHCMGTVMHLLAINVKLQVKTSPNLFFSGSVLVGITTGFSYILSKLYTCIG